jgi:hypothetical protein
MKKFFNRFSTVDKGGGVDALARQRNDESMAEKMQLQDGPATPSKTASGDRVKALAARFETLSGPDVQAPRSNGNGQPRVTARTSSHRQSGTAKVNASKEQPQLPQPPLLPPKDDTLQRTSPSLHVSATTASAKVAGETKGEKLSPSSSSGHPSVISAATLKVPSSTLKPAREGRDESSASGSSLGHSPAQQQQQITIPKTVAFAPSPKKPNRPSSPPPPLPINDASSSLVNVGSFAKATLASTARSRSTTRQQSTIDDTAPISTPHSPNTTMQPLSRPSSSLSTSRPVARRSSSSNAASRRGSNSEKGASQSSNPSMPPHSMASSLGFVPGLDSLPNSIPFTSAGAASLLRSASPQSIGTNSSKPGGNSAPSNLGSRPGSWTGRLNSNGSASQGWASSGAKSIGAPSWSEMTQEDLVSNLGARERTRQEVLWEIVASEERYVKELERTKEFYLETLLQPLQQSSSASPRLAKRAESSTRPHSMNMTATGSYTGLDYLGMDAAALSEDRTRKVREIESVATTSSPRSTKSAMSSANPKRWSNSRLAGQSTGGASSQIGYANAEGLGLSVPLPTSLRITLEAISNGLLQGHVLLSEALKQRYEEQWPLVRSLADIFTRYADVLHHYKDYVLHLERALDCLEEAALMERAMRGKRIKKDKLTVMVGLGRAVASLESAAMDRGECSLAIFLAVPFQRLLKYPLLFQNLLFHTDASTYEFESTVMMVVVVEKMIRSIEDEKVDKEERDKTLDAFARIEGIKDRALLKPKRDRTLVEERALYEENPRRAISESNEGHNEATTSVSKISSAAMSSHDATAAAASSSALKNKRSYRRLSDFLTVEDRANQSTKAPNMGSKKDLWLVRFSDVELKCQRVGVTALPMVSSVVLQQPQGNGQDGAEIREEGAVMTEEEIKIKEDFKRSKESKERMKALRNTTLRSKTRNLYRFVSVTSWKQVQKDKVVEADMHLEGLTSPQEVDEEDELDGGDEDEEDEDDRTSSTSQETDIGVLDTERYVRQSKLSFSYWGHDKVEPKPLPMARTQSQHSSSVAAFRSRDAPHLLKRHSLTPPTTAGPPALSSRVVASNSHAKAKADKFGNRLQHSQEGSLTPIGDRVSLSSRLAAASKTSIDENHTAIAQSSSQPMQQRAESPQRPRIQQRASLPEGVSIDSNLRIISSFIE